MGGDVRHHGIGREFPRAGPRLARTLRPVLRFESDPAVTCRALVALDALRVGDEAARVAAPTDAAARPLVPVGDAALAGHPLPHVDDDRARYARLVVQAPLGAPRQDCLLDLGALLVRGHVPGARFQLVKAAAGAEALPCWLDALRPGGGDAAAPALRPPLRAA